jgi:hypothetical protein
MNTFETTRHLMNFPTTPANLDVRFCFVDGSEETFTVNGEDEAERILLHLDPARLFKKSRIVVADDYSKSVFVCAHLSRIDFIYDGSDFSQLPPDHADLVELTEAEFRIHVPRENPHQMERRTQYRRVGDLMVSFLELRMSGGTRIYLMNETVVKLPVDSQSFMQRLLSKEWLGVRLRVGHAVLNLSNLIGYTVYPGVPEVPADTWHLGHNS